MSDLAVQIDALLALNAKGAVSHPIPGLAVELLERATRALTATRTDLWEPIETAPKDGTMILLYNTAHREQQVMGWSEGFDDELFPDGCWTNAGSQNKAISTVTNGGYFQFWQPIPAPPGSTTEGE